MSNEAEMPGVRVVRRRLGWPQLRLGLSVLVALLLAIMGLDELTRWLETRRLQRDQSPEAQYAEWQRVHQGGLAIARSVKSLPPERPDFSQVKT